MKKQFLDKFQPIEFFRKHKASQALELGLKLSSGMNLPDALDSIAYNACCNSEEKALKKASKRIKEGEKVAEVLNDKAIYLNGRDRYVLSLPIDDLQKGNILKSWLLNSKRRERYSHAVKIMAATMGIFAAVAIIMFVFVVPMFHEIVTGTNVNTGTALTLLDKNLLFIYDSGLYMLTPVLITALISLWGFLGKFIFNAKSSEEEAEIISMIAASDYEHQWQNIEMVSNKICFPYNYKKLQKLVESMKNGRAMEECIENANLSPMLTWFLQLSLHNREDRSFLAEGAEMLKQQADYMNNRQVRCFEISVIIMESLLIFVFIYYMFAMMEAIKLGALG